VTVVAKPRKKPKLVITKCVYCGAPAVGLVCAAHLDLLGALEAER
jgi:hypothetical protein